MSESTKKRRPRVSLGHLLLLVTAMAIGLAYVRVHADLSDTKVAVRNMRKLARELIVDDPSKIAAITRIPTLPGEHVMDVYIPARPRSDGPYQLCFALEDINLSRRSQELLLPPVGCRPISQGRHSIELRHVKADSSDSESRHEIKILLDDEVVMEATRPPDWMPADGWASTGSMPRTTVFDTSKPAQLHRRRFNWPISGGGSTSGPMDKPGSGILVWVE